MNAHPNPRHSLLLLLIILTSTHQLPPPATPAATPPAQPPLKNAKLLTASTKKILSTYLKKFKKAQQGLSKKKKADLKKIKKTTIQNEKHLMTINDQILKHAEAKTEKSTKRLEGDQKNELKHFISQLTTKTGSVGGHNYRLNSRFQFKKKVNNNLIKGISEVVKNANMARAIKRHRLSMGNEHVFWNRFTNARKMVHGRMGQGKVKVVKVYPKGAGVKPAIKKMMKAYKQKKKWSKAEKRTKAKKYLVKNSNQKLMTHYLKNQELAKKKLEKFYKDAHKKSKKGGRTMKGLIKKQATALDKKTKSLTEVRDQLMLAKREITGNGKVDAQLYGIYAKVAGEKKKYLDNQKTIKKLGARQKLDQWNAKGKSGQKKVINGVLKKGLDGWAWKHGRQVAEFKHVLRKKVRHSVSLDSQINSAVQKTKKQYLAMGGLYKKIKTSLK